MPSCKSAPQARPQAVHVRRDGYGRIPSAISARRERRGRRGARRHRGGDLHLRSNRTHQLAERRKRLNGRVAREGVDKLPGADGVEEHARVTVACEGGRGEGGGGRGGGGGAEAGAAGSAGDKGRQPATWELSKKLNSLASRRALELAAGAAAGAWRGQSGHSRIIAESVFIAPAGIERSLAIHCSTRSCSGCAARMTR